MKPLAHAVLNEDIQRVLDAIEQNKKALATTLDNVQEQCFHYIVSHVPLKIRDYAPNINPSRICNHCRLIEEGTIYSTTKNWHAKGYSSESILGNIEGRIIQEISREQFYKLRINI